MRSWKPCREYVIAAILLAGLLASLAVNWPGHINYDSAVQLAEGRAGQYQNWHPALMSWMLGVADAGVRGVCLFTLFDTLVLFGALLSLLWLAEKPSWAAAAIALACVAAPQFAIYPGVAWKDVLFATAGVAAFVCLAHAAVQPGRRIALLGLGLGFAVVAALARQHGAVVVLFAALAIGWICARHGAGPVPAVAAGAAALAVSAAAISIVFAALAVHFESDYDAVADQIKQLRAFDIVSAVQREPALKLEILARADPSFERLARTRGVELNRSHTHDPLADDETFATALGAAPDDAVSGQWFEIVTRHPLLYLSVRAGTFGYVVTTPDPELCPPVEVGVSADHNVLRKLGIPFRKDGRDLLLDAYAFRAAHTPLLSHVFYLVVGCGALAFLVRRRRPADLAFASMLLSALAFTAIFFVIAVACDYRYLLFVDVSAMTAALYIALTLGAPRLPRKPDRTSLRPWASGRRSGSP